MTPEAQRIAIAEACGWTINEYLWHDGTPRGYPPKQEITKGGKGMVDLPDYLTDLNAMHEAERTIDTESKEWKDYPSRLWEAMAHDPAQYWGTIHATAKQRAESFLRATGRWKE